MRPPARVPGPLPRRAVLRRGAALAGALALAGPACVQATPTTSLAPTPLPTAAPPARALVDWRYLRNTPDFSAQPRYGGVARYAINADPAHLDPIRGLSYTTLLAVTPVYNRLVRPKFGPELNPFDPYRLEVTGDLAESWEISPDGLEYTFKLRPDIRWQNRPPLNGRPFTAEDAQWSLDQYRQADDLRAVFAAIRTIEAVDPRTLVLRLYLPASYLLSLLAENRILMLPREVAEAEGSFQKTAVGTGPFLLKEFTPGARLVYEKNPAYFLPNLPYLDGIEVSLGVAPEDQRAGFRTGKYHRVQGDTPTLAEVEALARARPEAVTYERRSYSGAAIYRLDLRMDRPPFHDVRARRALSMAIDREAIIYRAYAGKASTLHHLPWWVAFDREPESLGRYYRYDPQEARRLFAEAGVVAGQEIEFSYFPYAPSVEPTVQVIAEHIERAGLRLKPVALPFDVWTERYSKGQFEGIAYGFTRLFPRDPGLNDLLYLRSDSPANVGHLYDPSLDGLLESLAAAVDPAQQRAAYRRLWDYHLDQMILPGLPEPAVYGYHSPQIHNVLPNWHNEGFHYGGASNALVWLDA
jgi:peptide/nickel transport system substrate-binding protein